MDGLGSGFTIEDPRCGYKPESLIGLPSVSVIVVNYNLSRFLGEAVECVMAQPYPNIECLIVDDASTDNSREVIADLVRRFPTLKVKLLAENGGSPAASVAGLDATTGQFVHFLDADDLIFETFIETHIAAQLSLRFPAGFSCCDMVHASAGLLSTCGDANISRYIHRGSGKLAPRKPLPPAVAAALQSHKDPEVFAVEPWHAGWPWTATSAIVYRRSALLLFAAAKGIKTLRISADAFFCYGINAVTGSVILDTPLAVYRRHGGNEHLVSEPLDHVLSFDRDKRLGKTAKVLDALIAHVIDDCRSFERIFWDRPIYYQLQDTSARDRLATAPHPAQLQTSGRCVRQQPSAALDYRAADVLTRRACRPPSGFASDGWRRRPRPARADAPRQRGRAPRRLSRGVRSSPRDRGSGTPLPGAPARRGVRHGRSAGRHRPCSRPLLRANAVA